MIFRYTFVLEELVYGKRIDEVVNQYYDYFILCKKKLRRRLNASSLKQQIEIYETFQY